MTEVVVVLIWDENRFLICQRPASKARSLLWESVGGKVELAEAKKQVLIRECREELGITVQVGSVFCEVTHGYPGLMAHSASFHAAISSGTSQKLEYNDIRWITSGEIPQYKFCPADVEILEKIIQSSKSIS